MDRASRLSAWLKPTAHDQARSIAFIRVALAIIIAVHPLYTMVHPAELRALAESLRAHGFPVAAGVAWAALLFQLACSLALIARRLVVPACIGSMVVLAAGIAIFYAPRWFVAGGAAEEGHPGAEFNVLLIAGLAGVLWSHGRHGAERGLDIVRLSAALLILPHPLHPFVTWDVEGMRQFGEGMARLGFPLGVPMVWGVVTLQIVCSIALIARRLVVPACVGHILVLCNGIWFVHAPNWFIVGPGENGMEFPLVYIIYFVSFILAYWPRERSVAAGQVAAAALILMSALSPGARAHAAAPKEGERRWITTWGASPQPADPALAITGQTLRQIVRVSIGGARVRVRLSNAYGTLPLHIGAAHVATRGSGSSIVAGSDRALTFGGAGSVIIPPGALVESDPVALTVAAANDLAISLYLPGAQRATTEHSFALQTTYVSAAGDFTSAQTFTAKSTTHAWYFLSGVEVEGAADAHAIVALGDSITDGAQSTLDANHRWTDFLAARLNAGRRAPRAVVNQGIAGNCLLRDLVGASMLARLDSDVLARPGVKFVIVLAGVNDLGVPVAAPDLAPTAEQIIAGQRQIIERAHELGLTVIGGTLTPVEGSDLHSPAGERARQAVNQWIRSGGGYDKVIDFDRALRDPRHPARLSAAFDSGDHVHPNDAGYKAMADAVDLTLFD